MKLQRALSAGTAALALVLVATGCSSSPSSDASASSSTTTPAATAEPTPSATATASSATASPTGSTADTASSTSSSAAAGNEGSGPSATGSALAALETLPVKGRAPKTGYDRDQFGPRWSDTDHNGCDTRNDILARDLTGETFKPGTGECVVLTGVLDDPYTATEIHFVRGQDTSDDVQIDHVVALSDAWQKGAQQLSAADRTEFANDPLNLLAVDGPANAQKSDSDAASWLPPNTAFRCDYVARQIAVKAEYELWVTAAEKDAMVQVLSSCADQELPTAETAATAYAVTTRSTQSPTPAAPKTTAPAPKKAAVPAPRKTYTPAPAKTKAYTPAPTQKATPLPTKKAASNVYYKNCSAARAAGAAPVYAGQPGYARHLDRDGDGVGCE